MAVKGKNPIHLNPKNAGKFNKTVPKGQTALQHAKQVMSNPKATPLQKKRANFIIVSKDWRKVKKK
jgi:hypothetical protein